MKLYFMLAKVNNRVREVSTQRLCPSEALVTLVLIF